MKKITIILGIVLLFVGCKKDAIFEKGKAMYAENGEINEITDSIFVPDSNGSILKNVLLETYTGVRCVNSPVANQLALEIQEKYDNKVIVLNVHAGFLAEFPSFNLTTLEGEEWWSFFNFQSTPLGTINRKIVNGGYDFNSPSWEDAVAEAVQEKTNVEISAEVTFNDANRELKVDVASKFLAEMHGTYSLTVCVMEDSIVGIHYTTEGVINDYIHRHVFRGTIDNKAWGAVLNQTSVAPEDVFVKSYTAALNETFNAYQCYIIAYVANTETKEILQVIKKRIK